MDEVQHLPPQDFGPTERTGARETIAPRNADSRPEPGPETSTSSVRMPCSEAFFTASSAAIWAAKGVDLREPLNPMVPAEDHEIVLPCASVMVIMVLLNVEFT